MSGKFTFIVNCNSKEVCDIVSRDMLDSGFKNVEKILDDPQGDHLAMKWFTNLDEAEIVAEKIFNRYRGKIHQITIR